MMVVAARREEGRLRAVALHEVEAHHVAVEADGAVDVRDLEVDMADAGCGFAV
jgi:hypothetical protein